MSAHIDETDRLDVPAVAHILRLNVHTVRRRFYSGEIPGAVKFGRAWSIARGDLEAHIAAKKAATARTVPRRRTRAKART